MDVQTQRWLDPMLRALLVDKAGGAYFARLMDGAISDAISARFGGIDWIGFGQLIRTELAWENYPSSPSG